MDLSEMPRGEFLRHPWELARAAFFSGELRRVSALRASATLLDVGSGDAWFARELAAQLPEFEITCWDVGYVDQKPPSAERVRYVAERPSGPFDVALMLDVSEHVPDDTAFLADVVEVLSPGGHLLFSVPAWPRLYTSHDEALRHYRRYTPRAARSLLQGTGLQILRAGGLFHSLLGPRYLQARLEGRPRGVTLTDRSPPPPDDLVWTGSRLTRGLVLTALAIDRGLTKASAALGVEVPGLSWWALCRK